MNRNRLPRTILGEKKLTIMKPHLCKICGAPIYGRSDKKYCSVICKDIANNHTRKIRVSVLHETLDQLEINYRILKAFHNTKKGIPLSELDALGFCADICTSFRKEGNRNICCCYNIEYKLSKQKIYDIKLLF